MPWPPSSATISQPGETRVDSLEILNKNRDTLGDRGLAWAALLLCHPEDPAVLGFVCGIIRTDPHYVHFLGHTLLPAAYPGHPSVAQAIEDSLRADPHSYMDSELSALAGIDHGPAIKDALLQSMTRGSFPHWAASALATRWEDDEEARAALRAVLEGEPVRASYAAAAAVPVLGREAAVERLLALLALPRNGQRRVRADIIAIALAGIYRDEADAPGADAERVAAACLEELPHPGDEYEATAEGEIIAAMGATQAARDRARSMLARPQIPLTTLAAGYARDPEALRPVLRRLHETFPSLPAQLRAYLCTLLRTALPTARWPATLPGNGQTIPTTKWPSLHPPRSTSTSVTTTTAAPCGPASGTRRWRQSAVRRSSGVSAAGGTSAGHGPELCCWTGSAPSMTSAPGKFPHG